MIPIPPQLAIWALGQIPGLVGWAREKWRQHHPNPEDSPPTEEEIIASFEAACRSTLAKDDTWLAAHPRKKT